MRVVLLGPPGAGKGTQAGRIADAFAIPHISTGDIFRANLRDETPLGLQAKKYMDAGQLVPDDVTNSMVADRLAQPDALRGFVLDGYPRTVDQAEKLEQLLGDEGRPVDVVLKFEVDEDELLERLTGRRSCPNGHIFHVRHNPPAQEGICDICGEQLFQRADDTEDVARERLAVYRRDTEPLEHFYWERGALRPVMAVGEVDDVTERALSILKEYGEPPGA